MTTSMKTLAGGLVAVMNPRLPPSRIMWTRYGSAISSFYPGLLRVVSGRPMARSGET